MLPVLLPVNADDRTSPSVFAPPQTLALREVRCTFVRSGHLAQLVERYLDMVEVTGSSPVLHNPETRTTRASKFDGFKVKLACLQGVQKKPSGRQSAGFSITRKRPCLFLFRHDDVINGHPELLSSVVVRELNLDLTRQFTQYQCRLPFFAYYNFHLITAFKRLIKQHALT